MMWLGGRCLWRILLAVGLPLAAAISAGAQGPPTKVVEIEVGDNMRFSPATIEAQPGQQLRVVLKPVGKIAALAHNFVLLKKGIGPKAFVDKASAATKETGAIPSAMKDQVIASSPLVKSGDTGEVTFEAPTRPGEYDFVCTFPGHFNLGMRGQLVVK
jgi:azurin